MYHFQIVIGCMLLWKCEGVCFSDAFLIENHLILMEAGEHVFKVNKGPLYNNTVLSYVTEFEKSLNCMKHLFIFLGTYPSIIGIYTC
jgi:hypothetical protein